MLNVNPEPHSGTDLDTLFDQDVLWAHAADFIKVPEDRISATNTLMKEIGSAMQDS